MSSKVTYFILPRRADNVDAAYGAAVLAQKYDETPTRYQM